MPRPDAESDKSVNATSASRTPGGGAAPGDDGGDDISEGTGSPGHSKLGPGLYIVATPIGNARDITLRALDVLKDADVVACEDTRVSRKLFTIYGIEPKYLVAYHEHNAAKMRPAIMRHLNAGETVALISDAGTPLVNDPGYRLVGDCREAGVPVHAVPGASAVLCALVSAGLPTDRFTYAGFPPPKSGKRRGFLEELAPLTGTLVFLESPNRLAATLADMAEVFGPRQAVVARELTKRFEETRPGLLADLAAHYADAGPPKGEVTLVVAGAPEAEAASETDTDAMLADALGRMSLKEAAAAVAAATGRPRRDVYARALALMAAQETGVRD